MGIAVVVASRHGSTREVAEAIAAELRLAGHDCSIEEAGVRGGSAAAADAVVLGSPIYMGKWTKEARRVADGLAAEGGRRPVYAFSCGPLGDPPEPEVPPAEDLFGDLASSVRIYEPFPGKLEPSSLSRRERLMARAVKAPEGDFRDFAAARDFASRVVDDLSSDAKG